MNFPVENETEELFCDSLILFFNNIHSSVTTYLSEYIAQIFHTPAPSRQFFRSDVQDIHKQKSMTILNGLHICSLFTNQLQTCIMKFYTEIVMFDIEKLNTTFTCLLPLYIYKKKKICQQDKQKANTSHSKHTLFPPNKNISNF